jgi:hypothetical protein
VRIFVLNHEDAETGLDVPEYLARSIFDRASNPDIRSFEAAIRAALSEKGGAA